MRRRDFITAIGGAATWTHLAKAQQRRPRKIGYLYAGSLDENTDIVDAFRNGLANMGFVEGRNAIIEFRAAHHDRTLLPKLARDLVDRQVDVIVVPGSTPAALAAKAATATIPIVFNNAGDPIKAGLVASLSHPGANVTGIMDLGNALSAKRLEFIKLLAPGASLIALLVTPNTESLREIGNAREGARALGFDILALPASTAEDIDGAFATLAQKRVDGVCVSPTALFFDHQTQIVALAARHRVPAAYPFIQFVLTGGLMSYGSNLTERNYQAGQYTGLILNGRNPADLPIRRLASFELAINMPTARTLGLTVPASFIVLADKVIE